MALSLPSLPLPPLPPFLAGLSSRISGKAFLQGMAVVGAFYALVFIYAVFFKVDREQDILFAEPPRIYLMERPDAEIDAAFQSSGEQSAHTSDQKMHQAPVSGAQGLYEETSFGILPRKSADGLTPFKAYQRPYAYQGKPVIALAVMDYGMSEKDSAAALDQLPNTVTFIMNPYAPNLEKWQKDARTQGREIWLYVPTETASFPRKDPGPEALQAHLDSSANRERLYWTLSRAKDFAGVALDADGTMTSSRLGLQKITDDIFDRGLGYMDMNKDAPSFFEVNALGRNAPYIRSQQAVLGNGDDDRMIFAALEKQAHETGSALAIIRLHPQSLKNIKEWAATLAARGIDLAPVSAIAQAEIVTPQ